MGVSEILLEPGIQEVLINGGVRNTSKSNGNLTIYSRSDKHQKTYSTGERNSIT